MASRGRRLPQFVVDQIRRLRREGKSVRQIADLAGVAKSTVEIYAAAAGPSSATSGRPFRKRRPATIIEPKDLLAIHDLDDEDLDEPFP